MLTEASCPLLPPSAPLPPLPAAASNDAHLRQHSLRLLQLCLAALCKLELPADVAGGNALGRLQAVLFGDGGRGRGGAGRWGVGGGKGGSGLQAVLFGDGGRGWAEGRHRGTSVGVGGGKGAGRLQAALFGDGKRGGCWPIDSGTLIPA